MDNKTGKNYFGHMSQQPRSIAFEKDATNMLTDKELSQSSKISPKQNQTDQEHKRTLQNPNCHLQMLKLINWHGNSQKINFLHNAWKIGKSTWHRHPFLPRLM